MSKLLNCSFDSYLHFGGRQFLRSASLHTDPCFSLGSGAINEPAEPGQLKPVNRRSWKQSDLHVVLVEPQIPQNTGCIARTCAATAVPLHLVEPLAFKLDSSKLKRAGLDYWPHVCMKVHSSWKEFINHYDQIQQPKRLVAFSARSSESFTGSGFHFQRGDWMLFGSETVGLPKEVLDDVYAQGGRVVKIPIVDRHVRSLNVSVAAGIGVYEAIRQVEQAAEESLTHSETTT
ncbi:hypothetical protein CEUSTIGMA_g664.t1 [Chlamydomonas eustigma]|uniref:tRNA/rRNA methyltransferase SpoU type domain-containing protein n=1 Tax=Chlamydomonas eustigma TaxID=1157962 RepID=A0A250WQZ3_9CHLO|nr:hypothetical protein CEUSTIGMA_g664.t1 [Chlamydomonas eustigma]|eukprot:GAX73211.1 hypothetical protein CEUSTIGMA_g664.t1 [Chlamydomonas eustigma]